jgi:predicted pyridoxine 5'-phosphate oxidase superfamily flavin-nucleotide-binding protein
MSDTHVYSSDVAFTPAVKAIQARKGSRDAYARVEQNGGWRTGIDENLAAFLADANSFYMATATADGQPYIQHRGGPKGFIKILDRNTIAFADYSGNRQYITQGNLTENPKAHIFVMDYAHRRRVKIWGEARVVDDDPALLKSLMPAGYKARPEQVIIFKISAWDTNCPQHIPQKIRRRRCRSRAGLARRADRRAGSGGGKIENCGIGGKLIALNHRNGNHRRCYWRNQPLPGLRRLLLVFKQLATLHHRGRRRAGSHSARIRQRQIVGNALRGRALFGIDREGWCCDVVRNLCDTAGGVPELHARRSRMRHGAAQAWAAGAGFSLVVVPAKAGTHNHRARGSRTTVATSHSN